ncbi:dienelactone hydrolase family protein [Commensalibacter oyaizuii]|uniref:Dienelactone hydrolase family protein n=1 Tax=Commensalibacter oyaizuii TaxID=3043873 RepID=A0ABT6PYX8_9PROT|nr:dienelactone hydrolase family protein [Commensalibacter sp. TBRC 16381]MDI2090024.1 dienelactone hydrolase family protein [Commensalibacter sp. TBRC 16381]
MKQDTTIITSDHHHLHAYESTHKNVTAGLVVLQEIFGVNHHIRNVCDNFANQGYHVISPALFDRVEKNVMLGYEQTDIQKGFSLRSQIDPQKTLLDIIAAAQYLPYSKIGVVGYCWGGSLSWRAATETDIFSAASCWYGAMIPSLLQHPHRCPVQMHFGALDASIPLDQIEQTRLHYNDVEIYIYENADHGFGCQARSSFNPTAYQQAQQRTLDLFKKYL